LDTAEKQERLDRFEKACRERGMPITVQRRSIYQAALELGTHPTADEVHAALAPHLPQISRTTVYRTLETLHQIGVITKVSHPGGVIRYDLRTNPHHHLLCLHCQRIIDFSDAQLDALRVSPPAGSDFEVRDFRVTLRGVCRRCREQEGRS
jgi:Fur family peroxide stress response transcriptional regulator